MEKRLQGSLHGLQPVPHRHAALRRPLPHGRLELDALVAERIGLDDIPDAFAKLEGGESVRSVVVFD